MDIVVSSNC